MPAVELVIMLVECAEQAFQHRLERHGKRRDDALVGQLHHGERNHEQQVEQTGFCNGDVEVCQERDVLLDEHHDVAHHLVQVVEVDEQHDAVDDGDHGKEQLTIAVVLLAVGAGNEQHAQQERDRACQVEQHLFEHLHGLPPS